jgi:hypothetical protein
MPNWISCGITAFTTSIEACVRDLGLDAATSARLFGDSLGAAT